MSEKTTARPRQVTLAAWMIMVGSVIVVALVYDRIGGLHSIETRESVESFLSQPPGSDLDLGVDGVLTIIRTLSMVAAGCATAAAILGFHVLRRSRSARLALSILAVPLFLTGMVTGGFAAAVIAASSAMLWLQPARSWFAGEPLPPARPGRDSARLPEPPAGGQLDPHGPGPAGQPSAGQPPVGQPSAGQPPVGQQPAAWPQPWPAAGTTRVAARTSYPVPEARPAAVVWACVLTWVTCGLGAAAMLLSGVVILLDPDMVIDQAHQQQPDLAEQGVTDGLLLGAAFAMIGAAVLWCLAAMVVALFAFRRHEWARLTLVISASVAAVGALLGAAIGAILLFVPLAGAAVTIGLLARPDSRLWFAHRGEGTAG